jgi:hypothetical protein
MNFKPRYSLLTLLLFTAVIAGGVKLWYGPHHVVERPDHRAEDEYTYTRTWNGKKVLQGPRVFRLVVPETGYRETHVSYYRQGVQLKWEYWLFEARKLDHWQEPLPPALQDNPMTEEEYAKFQSAIQREKQQKPPPGLRRFEYERASLAYSDD